MKFLLRRANGVFQASLSVRDLQGMFGGARRAGRLTNDELMRALKADAGEHKAPFYQSEFGSVYPTPLYADPVASTDADAAQFNMSAAVLRRKKHSACTHSRPF